MNKLLLRILAWMFLALLAAMAAQFALLSFFYGRFFADPEWYPIRNTAFLVREILDSTPPEELAPEKEWLETTLQRQIDIIAAGDAAVDDAIGSRLMEGRPVYDGCGLFYMPFHDGDRLAMMSPAFHQYKSLLKPGAVLFSCVMMGFVAAVVGFFMTRPLSRRLNVLEAAAERIRQGDILTRVRDASTDLIGNVGRCFNQMAERIQFLVMIRQHLLNSVACKFQDPVQDISRQLDALSGESGPAEVKERSGKIDAAVDGIEQMVTGLLLNEKKQRSEFNPIDHEPASAEGRSRPRSGIHSGVMRFIGRMSLGILIVLLVHQLFMIGVSQVAYKYLDTDPAWYPAKTIAALAVRAVQRTDRENLPNLLTSLRDTLDRRIDLLSADAGKALIRTDGRMFAGMMAHGIHNGSEVFYAPVSGGDLSVLIAPGYSQYRRKPSILFHSSFLVFEFLLTTLFGVFLSRPIIRNLKKLETGIERIRRGDLGARVDIPPNMPTGHLAGCLNHMARQIESLLEHQKHLIQAVAHEIRTPISRIRFYLEMLPEAEGGGEMEALVANIGTEVDELDRLVGELVTFSDLDAMAQDMETAPIEIRGLFTEIAAYHKKIHGHIEIVLEGGTENNLTLNANPIYFKRAIQNILSNALRYAQDKVVLCCSTEKDGVRIDILDDGPGIPAESRETVLQPFTRLDGSRSRRSGGFGLGLAIVDRIVSLHGGAVSIGDNRPRGARITTWWPNPPRSAEPDC